MTSIQVIRIINVRLLVLRIIATSMALLLSWLTVASVQGIPVEQEIDISGLNNIPTKRTLDLFEEVRLVIDERSYEETGLVYQLFDLPPGLRFDPDKRSIVGRTTALGTYTFTVLIRSDYLPEDSTIPPAIRQYRWTVKLSSFESPNSKHSVARQWNEVLLEAIRKDFARPTVHARNLFHVSSAMYDAWALYDETAIPYFLGGKFSAIDCGAVVPDLSSMSAEEIASARHEAISHAAYRLLSWRFKNSPGHKLSQARFDHLMSEVGYLIPFEPADQCGGTPAAWGAYIAQSYIDYGLVDGANEAEDYASQFYTPANMPMSVKQPVKEIDIGQSASMVVNRWSPLAFDVFVGQSNYVSVDRSPDFVSPEWGQVSPFALSKDDLMVYERDGGEYWIYHDPGPPPTVGGERHEEALWGFLLVPKWASFLDTVDGVRMDISPRSIGNNQAYEASFEFMQAFYSPDGGDNSPGHTINPHTGKPYAPNVVARADYGRVIAEFWADGPDSETPPGHWFTLLNQVNDHPALEKRYLGQGNRLDDLEWDIKSYFALGGAMHDSAVAAWGIKGWYDYARPISAVRYMSFFGQHNPSKDWSEHPYSLPLIPGFIEKVGDGDEPLLSLSDGEISDSPVLNDTKLKMYTWRGPDYIENPETDIAGVGWILAEDWWPYQRPTFVTPPFAGYVSGHSTFSRAAAEVLTLLTGNPFFPGGMGEFLAPKNEFLVFEEGPSEDVILQWATYQDAADQSAISRIWGGIHPPADDMPARLIGAKVGRDAFAYADGYFNLANAHSTVGEPVEEPTEILTAEPTPARTEIPIEGEISSPHEVLQPIYGWLERIFGRTK